MSNLRRLVKQFGSFNFLKLRALLIRNVLLALLSIVQLWYEQLAHRIEKMFIEQHLGITLRCCEAGY